ncbi:MAG: hypothetical protein HKP25_03045, partial [Marinicaulis sp.]|nr:hypothetical protein [Marinicaulis sp.]NNL88021.1 hypothetical protein [Marinicaulis sp.]
MSDQTLTEDEMENGDETLVAEKRKSGPIGRMFRRDPLLPEAGAGGAPLTAVIAVISFLAVLAMAAALIIDKSTSEWTASLRSEVTVQIKGADAAEISARANSALDAIRNVEGVTSASLMTQTDAAALLEPWLGEGNASAFLNIPALIEVQVSPTLRRDLQPLRVAVAEAAPGAGIDDHAVWHDRLSA